MNNLLILAIWQSGNAYVHNLTAANCAVTAGVQGNWGSCMGTYAFKSLHIDGLRCLDPFLHLPGADQQEKKESSSDSSADADACNPRTHFTAIHINHAFQDDCMPLGAVLSLSNVSYFASQDTDVPVPRPKCGQCEA